MVVERSRKLIFLLLGWLFLVLAIIGIPLPILPTTPFLILSAYFFSKSSEKLHEWLLNTKYLGPMILDWEKNRVIRMKAKVLSTIMIVSLFSYTLLFVDVPIFIKIIVSFTGLAALSFIWTRPSKEKISSTN